MRNELYAGDEFVSNIKGLVLGFDEYVALMEIYHDIMDIESYIGLFKDMKAKVLRAARNQEDFLDQEELDAMRKEG